MLKKFKNIFGLLVIIAALASCSKDADLYTPSQGLNKSEKEVPSAMPVDPNANEDDDKGTFDSGTAKPTPSPAVGGSNGNISISDDDDDEDDDN